MTDEINSAHEVLVAFLFTAAFGVVFLVSELIYAKFKVHAEYTRKFVHVSCGSIAMLITIADVHFITVIILGLVFIGITWYMLTHGLLPSLHAVDRHSIGTVLFPAGVVLCVGFGLLTDYGVTFYIPLSTMIYCDTIAALVGVNYPLRKLSILKHTKSIGGSFAFFIAALLVYLIVFHFILPSSDSNTLLYGVAFAGGTTVVEFFSVDGWDDFTLPCAAMGLLYVIGYS